MTDWVIKPYEPISKDAKICECKLYKRDGRWWLDVIVERDIPERTRYQNVMDLNMGLRNIVTSVELRGGLLRYGLKPMEEPFCLVETKISGKESNRNDQEVEKP